MDFICPMCSDTTTTNTEANPSVESTELPPYTVMSPPSFIWNNVIEGVEFVQSVSVAYDEVVYWRHNLFLVPMEKLDVNLCKNWLLCFAPMVRVLHWSVLP